MKYQEQVLFYATQSQRTQSANISNFTQIMI